MLFELQSCLRCMDHFSKVLNTESAYVVPRGLAAPSCYAFLQLIQTISRVKPSAISVYDIPSIDVLQIQGIYLRAAALAADPGKECEEAEGGPRPRFCFLVAAESNGSCKGIGLPRVGDTAQLSQTKIAAGVGSLLR